MILSHYFEFNNCIDENQIISVGEISPGMSKKFYFVENEIYSDFYFHMTFKVNKECLVSCKEFVGFFNSFFSFISKYFVSHYSKDIYNYCSYGCPLSFDFTLKLQVVCSGSI